MTGLKARLALRTIILAASTFAPWAATAQVFDMGGLTNTLTIPTDGGARKPVAGGMTARKPIPAGDIRLSYTPTPEIRRAALAGYLARIRQKSPDNAQVMAAQFARNDYTKVYHDLIAGSTIRENDAVDVVTAYTLLGWQIANEVRNGISDRQFEGVRRQMAPPLAANPRIADPRNRASLGEEMKLMYITVLAGWQSAAKDGSSKACSDGITATFKQQSGRDLRALKLTDAGFVPK